MRRAAGPVAWLVSTAVATAVAWWAVTAVGAGAGAPDAVLSESQVAAALTAERAALATATPTPTPTAEPTPSASPTAPPSGTPDTSPVIRTWTLDGGVVSASCSGDVISLEYATPASGWRVDAKERGPGARVLVELEREGTEVYVQAVCVNGTPEHTLAPDAPDAPDEDADGGADGERAEDG